MRTRMMIPLAVALVTFAGCDGNNLFEASNQGTGGVGVVPTSSARVRFFHALLGAEGRLLLTSNGTVVGTPQDFAITGSCTTVAAGDNRRLVVGDANAAGTALADTIASVTTSLASGGNYTIVAIGTIENPQILVLDNNATAPPAGNVNLRLVNATLRPIDFFATPTSTLGTPLNANIFASAAGTFAVSPVQNTTLTFRTAGTATTLLTSTGTFSAGQSYNVLLIPNELGTDFQSVTTTRC